jgi:predicted RNA-binding protein with PUA-like domain
MKAAYWLMKSEPGEFSITDLKNSPGRTASWDGVRNYQARNFMRDQMQIGDRVLFYHSGAERSIVGVAEIVKTGYPDPTARDRQSKHFDPRSTPQKPVWYMVDIRFQEEFPQPIALARLKTVAGLENMMLLRKGIRLSIQPVTAQEFTIILSLVVAGNR